MKKQLPALLWLLPALAVMLLWQLAATPWVGTASLRGEDRIGGFAAAEDGPSGAFRWAGPAAYVRMPAGGLPGVLELRGAVAPGAGVELRLGDAPPVSIPAPAAAPQVRRYALLLPAQPDALGWVTLRLAGAPAARLDGRDLSMALVEARIAPVERGPRLPPPGLWLALGALPALLGLGLWCAGLSPRTAGWLCAIGGLALALLWHRDPALVYPRLLDVQAFATAGDLWRWWLLAQLAGLAAWPILRRACGSLPLTGYPVARALGLLLVGWLAWIGAITGAAPFSAASVAGAWAIVAAAGWGYQTWEVLKTSQVWEVFKTSQVLPAARRLLGWELLFLAGLLLGCLLRWHGAVGPALTGTEKPMEIAILSAVLRYDRFPPLDPWFAGHGLNYYYLGYVIVGALAKVAGTDAPVAFNLGFALVVALTVVGVAYVAASMQNAGRPLHRPLSTVHRPLSTVPAALLALTLTLAVGGQLSVLQLIGGTPLVRALDAGQLGELVGQRIAGAAVIRLSRATPPSWDGPPFREITPEPWPSFDWFLPSRAIYDDVALPGGGVERRYAITEFPVFSLYLGDLHPHVLAMPFNLLALALALAIVGGRRPGTATLAGPYRTSALRPDGAAGISQGASGNTWHIRSRQAAKAQRSRIRAPSLAARSPSLPGIGSRGGAWVHRQSAICYLQSGLAGFLVGCLYCINAWDAPTYALLLAGAVALSLRRGLARPGPAVRIPEGERSGEGEDKGTGGQGDKGAGGQGGMVHWRFFTFCLLPFALACLAAALPFLLTFVPPAGPPVGGPLAGLPILGRLADTLGLAQNRTQLHSFLILFGLLLLPIVWGLLAENPSISATGHFRFGSGGGWRVAALRSTRRPPPAPPLQPDPSAGSTVVHAPDNWLRRLAARRWSAVAGPERSRRVGRRLPPPGPWLIALALPIGPLVGFPLLFLLPLAALLALRAWRTPADEPGAALARWVAAVGALILLVPELVYIRDHLEGEMSRMITVFKFVFQAWLLWGIAAAYFGMQKAKGRRQNGAVSYAPPYGRIAIRPSHPRAIPFYLLPFTFLLAGALVYPFGLMRWAEPWRAGERSFDGLAFLAREAPDELAAARWLAANLAPEQVLLTGFCNCDYELVSRVGAISGVQTLLGWMDGHERVWRSGAPEQIAAIARRERDIPLIYTGDPQRALALLRGYGVDYVYIGPVERRLYGETIPLAERLPVAFKQGEVLVLEATPFK